MVKYSSMSTPSPLQLDATDLRLLALLQDDASQSNQALADQAHLSPATCHRRLKRLRDEGVIEKQVALLSPHRVAEALGWGVSALVEVSLDVQTQEALDAFEAHVVADAQVQQCWRVSPGPDFVLVVQVPDMPAYQALAQRLFTAHQPLRPLGCPGRGHQAQRHLGEAELGGGCGDPGMGGQGQRQCSPQHRPMQGHDHRLLRSLQQIAKL